MIGRDGRPRQKSLLDILGEWAEFRVATVVRRTQHRLGKVDDRIHILEGRQLVLLNIDEVIRIIRNSDEPKPALIEAFGLTDRQAEDILEIRLRQLARLEAIRIEKELAELRSEKAALEGLLASDAALRRSIVREIEADAKQYGDARRTLIEAAERTTLEVRVVEEPVTVIVSEKGWVRARQGHGHATALFGFKAGDAFYGAYEVMTTDHLYAIATNGRVYSIPVANLPSARGDGAPVTSFVEVEPGARIEHAFAAGSETAVLLATAGGNGLVCAASDWQSRMRAGKSFLALEAGDKPIRPAPFVPGIGTTVVCLSEGKGGGDKGRLLSFELDEVKVLKNGGRGVALMGLDKDERLRQVIICGRDGLVVRGTGKGGKTSERTMSAREVAEYAGARARKGRQLAPAWKDVRLDLPRREAR